MWMGVRGREHGEGSTGTGVWRRERGDRSVKTGVWKREHVDGSMEMGAWRQEHGDGSVETVWGWDHWDRIMETECGAIFSGCLLSIKLFF